MTHAEAGTSPRTAMSVVKNRVLFVLVACACAAAWSLAFLTVAPNRLVSGIAIPLAQVVDGRRDLLLVAAAVVAAGIFLPQRKITHAVVVAAATLLLFGFVWLAGSYAARLSETATANSRIALGSGFWLLALMAWFAAVDAIERIRFGPAGATLAHVAVLLPIAALVLAGGLDQVSLLREYASRRDVFHVAFVRHVEIVAAALVPTLIVGIPLGIALFRRARLQVAVFGVLNLIQTIPSIALFGLLIAPLALLAAALPILHRFGISGIGMAPAVIALVLYSLLHVVRSTVAGLAQVPKGVVEAATAMGLTRGQLFRKVELPIALPVFLSGVRIAAVQAIGLAVVAALIGAGGLGALVFQGLASGALDLVLLGVIPVVALAVAADAVFRLVAGYRVVHAG